MEALDKTATFAFWYFCLSAFLLWLCFTLIYFLIGVLFPNSHQCQDCLSSLQCDSTDVLLGIQMCISPWETLVDVSSVSPQLIIHYFPIHYFTYLKKKVLFIFFNLSLKYKKIMYRRCLTEGKNAFLLYRTCLTQFVIVSVLCLLFQWYSNVMS